MASDQLASPAGAGARDVMAGLRTPILRGARVLLRPLSISDWDAWREVRLRCVTWLGRWEPVLELGGVDPLFSRAAFASWCAAWEHERRLDLSYAFGIFLLDGRFVGEISVGGVYRGSFHTGYLGYWIDEAVAGSELAPEGIVLLMQYAFESLLLHRLEAVIMPDNHPSTRVAEKLTLRSEGLAVRFAQVAGEYVDHVRYAMTVEEWREGRDRLIRRFPTRPVAR